MTALVVNLAVKLTQWLLSPYRAVRPLPHVLMKNSPWQCQRRWIRMLQPLSLSVHLLSDLWVPLPEQLVSSGGETEA